MFAEESVEPHSDELTALDVDATNSDHRAEMAGMDRPSEILRCNNPISNLEQKRHPSLPIVCDVTCPQCNLATRTSSIGSTEFDDGTLLRARDCG